MNLSGKGWCRFPKGNGPTEKSDRAVDISPRLFAKLCARGVYLLKTQTASTMDMRLAKKNLSGLLVAATHVIAVMRLSIPFR
jgi:hypothetical protein